MRRTGRRILALFLVFALISALPVFSFADGEEVVIKDSGPPMVSMMSMRAIAADEGISLAAAEGNSGQFGYDIKPVDIDYSIGYSNYTNSTSGNKFKRSFIQVYNLDPGSYSFTVKSLNAVTSAYVYNWTTQTNQYTSNLGTSVKFDFTLTSQTNITLWLYAPVDSFDSYEQNTVLSITPSVLKPVEGISSGYTYNSGFLSRSTRSFFDYFDADFGSQPAGKYLVNIYHWGDSYNLIFHIHDSSDSYYLPSTTNGGVTTFVYNHSGGQFTFGGSFTASNDETSVIDGHLSGAGMGDYFQLLGELGADGPLSWTFNITDIVAIPYEQAADFNFGFFAPIIGFLRDGFSSIKSNVVTQFTQLKTHLTTEFTNLKSSITTQFSQLKTLITNQFTRLIDFLNDQYSGAVSSELSQDMNSAESMIEQENQFTDSINTQITEQSSKVDPVTVLDGIEGSSNVFSSMLWVSSIVSSGINGMGVFQFLIYVPMILGIVTLVIGRGASIAGRRPRPQPVNVRKGK